MTRNLIVLAVGVLLAAFSLVGRIPEEPAGEYFTESISPAGTDAPAAQDVPTPCFPCAPDPEPTCGGCHN